MSRNSEIAEFNLSDGFTPQQVQKLNYNFRASANRSDESRRGVGIELSDLQHALAFESDERRRVDAENAEAISDEAEARIEKDSELEDAIADLEETIEHIGPGTNDYNLLINKPQIEGVTLQGNKTFDELNLIDITNSEIEAITTL